MKLLLVSPRFPESLWSFQWAVDVLRDEVRSVNPPVGLATVAALCPPSWEVEIADENIAVVPLETDADIVGICGMGVQVDRQLELAAYYRARGHVVVVGGSYASLCPEAYEGLVDAVISGEAEYIWPEFCRDFERGTWRALYREDGVVDLADSPVPRFDLLDLARYGVATIQFSRGCPFRCEFCDIIVMFGRKPRTKAPEQVVSELDALAALGVRDVFFTDDNFVGHKRAVQALLDRLVDYQAARPVPMRFGTEASIDLAGKPALMEGMRDAGFRWVFIGIETPDPAGLKEALKHQNLRGDLLDAVRRIYAHGIDIFAGFILGFDADTPATFELQRRFIMASGIQMANLSLLTAIPKTPLYARLQREGRLRESGSAGKIDVRLSTNVQPAGMSYDALVQGYRRLYLSLFEDAAIAARVLVKREHLWRRPPAEVRASVDPREAVSVAYRLLTRGVLSGGVARARAFFHDLPLGDDAALLQHVVDWTIALSVQSYLHRTFQLDDRRAERALSTLATALTAFGGQAHVSVRATRSADGARSVHVTAHDQLGMRRLFLARRLVARLLDRSPYDVVLGLRGLPLRARALRALMKGLRPHGSRVRFDVDAEWLRRPELPWYRFRYGLPAPRRTATAASRTPPVAGRPAAPSVSAAG